MLAACHVERLSGWFDRRADGDGVGVMKWVWVGFAAGGPKAITPHWLHLCYGERHTEREKDSKSERLLPHHPIFPLSQISLFPLSSFADLGCSITISTLVFNSKRQQKDSLCHRLRYGCMYPLLWVAWMTMSFLLIGIDSVFADKHAGTGSVSL